MSSLVRTRTEHGARDAGARAEGRRRKQARGCDAAEVGVDGTQEPTRAGADRAERGRGSGRGAWARSVGAGAGAGAGVGAGAGAERGRGRGRGRGAWARART
ncbi:hypothetical protein GCM10020218_079750 [Dactylosporangium vinaceum]